MTVILLAPTVPALAQPTAAGSPARSAFAARDDAYVISAGHTLTVRDGVLTNDSGVTALIRHTDPGHGALALNPDGSFRYTPTAGFTGSDTFTYTVSDAVKLYSTHLSPLATISGVPITAGGFGSSLAPVPGSADEYYGLEDRGPNVDGPNGTKIEPLPDFDPSIGKFKLIGAKAVLERTIPLRAFDGTPYNGRVNVAASTGESITDLNGTVLPPSPYGYDSEGLVALADGTFWVSDEYGPFITHFDRTGRQIGRLTPFDGSLPYELSLRVPNKGMEGLTITPDGHTLVGMMQSALAQTDLAGAKPANVAPVRIVTYDLRTGVTHEYLYLLTDPKINSGAVSEITALSATRFVVDERDGKFEPNAYKKLFLIDLAGATDVGPRATVAGAGYDALHGGLLVGGRTIEALVGTSATAAATTTLATAGITPVAKTLDVDLGGLLTTLDPTGGFFGHDKVEGVATTDHGRTLVVSNDSDFGIAGVTGSTPPFTLTPKVLPNGAQDDGEYLWVDTTRVADPVRTATVTITVAPTATTPGSCPPAAAALSYSDALDKVVYHGAQIGGLSDLAYDRRSGSFVATVDNHLTDPSRLWFFSNTTSAVITRDPLVLTRPDGTPYTGLTADNEGLAVLPDGDFLVSSETEPSIRIFGRDGRQRAELPVPQRFQVAPAGQATNNATLEGLSVSPDGRRVVAAMEGTLSGDVPADGSAAVYRRFLVYDSDTRGRFSLVKQIGYQVQPGNRISEVQQYRDGALLVMEAAYSPTAGNTIALYAVPRLDRSADVSGVANLSSRPGLVVEKELVADVTKCPTLGATAKQPQANPLMDNYEGMVTRPLVPHLYAVSLISDDNFNPTQITRLLNLVARLP